jgi:hypothetical protein
MKSGGRYAAMAGTKKTACLELRIAGVTLCIACPPNVRLHIPNRLYRSFKGKAAEKGIGFVLPVRLVTGGFPSLAGLKKKFDTGESWSLFQDAGYYWITFHPARWAEPLWVARFDRQVSRVTVIAGPSRQHRKKRSMFSTCPSFTRLTSCC